MKYRYAKRIKRHGAVIILVAAGMVAAVGLLGSQARPTDLLAEPGLSQRDACTAASGTTVACQARLVTHQRNNRPLATTTYSAGYAPSDLQSAYGLPTASGPFAWNGRTVAIVDAYDNPNAASDLLAYRQQFNLPLCADSTISCLLSKVNQSGTPSPLPTGNAGWGQEIDLDLQMASAACPQCKILLVEANSNTFADLGSSVDRAAAMGANAISNSYGGAEFYGETGTAYNGHFNHPGIAITVSAGDSGYGVSFPAASQYVTAVSGTTLTKSSSATRGWSESAWNGTGSGCSALVPKPSWQPQVGTCTHRVVADVSADANPYTGVAVYDSYGSNGGANWYVFGGTSVGAPLIAGVYTLAGNTGGTSPAITYGEYPYSHTPSLFDVTHGSNGQCTSRRNAVNLALCTAVSGYDGPTGLGTPNDVSAF